MPRQTPLAQPRIISEKDSLEEGVTKLVREWIETRRRVVRSGIEDNVIWDLYGILSSMYSLMVIDESPRAEELRKLLSKIHFLLREAGLLYRGKHALCEKEEYQGSCARLAAQRYGEAISLMDIVFRRIFYEYGGELGIAPSLAPRRNVSEIINEVATRLRDKFYMSRGLAVSKAVNSVEDPQRYPVLPLLEEE